ncbi:MAG: chemotaxis protein CheW, partial [Chromatiales bacterium]|nr:chemotaxis protein CheW [Chromatiales bacterium]
MHEEITEKGGVADNVEQFLTFVLSDEIYGINILSIREIVEHGNVTKVPMMPEFIAGVINLRGNVVPVVDLAQRFSTSVSEINKKSSIVILEIDDEDQKLEIGVTVDEVNEVLDISAAEIEATPSFGTRIRTDFICGMGKVGEQLLLLLNIENILS